MDKARDIVIIRDLAERYAEAAARPVQDERRALWRDHNSFVRTGRVPIFVLIPELPGVPDVNDLQCTDPFYRWHERWLRLALFQDTIGDDCVLEPWITQRATVLTPSEGLWGLPVGRVPSAEAGGAWQFDPAIKTLDDAAKMVEPSHIIDEESTSANVARLKEAVGDILEVSVDCSPAWFSWGADISTHLSYLRGLGQVMWDMVENPAWLHGVLAFMRDGILKSHEEAELAGDWRLSNHDNQAVTYCRELPNPEANRQTGRNMLWTHVSAQEFTLVSPAMHDEFMLQYQIPIMNRFGLSAYGCCEDLSEKIDMLRQIPNLRRIAVAPWANVHRCAEQIGTDYIFSYRPNPAEMVCCGFDPDHIRRVIADALAASKGCHVDITLKDVQTVEGQPERLREWVKIVRDVTEQNRRA